MSLSDSIFIFVVALIIFGPKKLPEMARQLGKLLGELRRASNEFKFQIEEELRQAEMANHTNNPSTGPVIQPPSALAPASGQSYPYGPPEYADPYATLPQKTASPAPGPPTAQLPLTSQPSTLETADSTGLPASLPPETAFPAPSQPTADVPITPVPQHVEAAPLPSKVENIRD